MTMLSFEHVPPILFIAPPSSTSSFNKKQFTEKLKTKWKECKGKTLIENKHFEGLIFDDSTWRPAYQFGTREKKKKEAA